MWQRKQIADDNGHAFAELLNHYVSLSITQMEKSSTERGLSVECVADSAVLTAIRALAESLVLRTSWTCFFHLFVHLTDRIVTCSRKVSSALGPDWSVSLTQLIKPKTVRTLLVPGNLLKLWHFSRPENVKLVTGKVGKKLTWGYNLYLRFVRWSGFGLHTLTFLKLMSSYRKYGPGHAVLVYVFRGKVTHLFWGNYLAIVHLFKRHCNHMLCLYLMDEDNPPCEISAAVTPKTVVRWWTVCYPRFSECFCDRKTREYHTDECER